MNIAKSKGQGFYRKKSVNKNHVFSRKKHQEMSVDFMNRILYTHVHICASIQTLF